MTARLFAAFVVVLLALSSAAPASAQLLRGLATHTATDVTLTTTTEAVAVTSAAFASPRETVQVLILAWGNVLTGTGTTAVAVRLRQGATTSGATVGESSTLDIKTTAGETEPFFQMATEERTGGGVLEYSFTLAQVGASANGTVTQAGILVFVF